MRLFVHSNKETVASAVYKSNCSAELKYRFRCLPLLSKGFNSMKTRIITAIAAIIVILVPCFVFLHTFVLPLVMGLFAGIAVYEIIKATGGKNKLLQAISCATAAVVPMLVHLNIEIPFMPVAIIYVLAYLIIMVPMHKTTKFNDVVTALFATLAVPLSLSIFVFLRDIYILYPYEYTKENGVFLILLAMFSAWMTDTMAYFSGKFLGRHKLCPNVSPNKTIEGAVGGVIGNVIASTVMFFIFDKFFFTMHTFVWWQIIIISAVLSVISMFGDLSASLIKRNNGIKDFGNIFPGHGGVMDRIDSCLFVLPALWTCLYIINM